MTPRHEIPFPPPHQPAPPPHARPDQLFVPVRPRWEYRELVRDADALPTDAELNALGDEGWELVVAVPVERRYRFYFKRERPI